MNESNKNFSSIDEYIESQPKDLQPRLKELRKVIHQNAEGLTEKIAYGMPAFDLGKTHLVYFAGYKNHIGFYPFPSGIAEFQDEAEKLGFKTSKGTIQFPNDKEIPWDLVERIVKFRVKESTGKVKSY